MRAHELKEDRSELKKALQDFLPIAMRVLKIESLPAIKIRSNVENPEQPTFGAYENASNTVYLAVKDRHVLDILRTLAHELTHFKQDVKDQLDIDSGATGSPEENEGHKLAGVIMRHFGKKHPEYFNSKAITESLDFMEGECPVMAIALHKLTGFPLMALVEHSYGETYLMHAYVGVNDKWRLDAEGFGTTKWYMDRFPHDPSGEVEEVQLTEQELLRIGYEADGANCPPLSQVLPVAKEVLQGVQDDLAELGIDIPVNEDWRNWATGLGAASMLAGGGMAGFDAYNARQSQIEPPAHVQQAQKKGTQVKAPQAQITQQQVDKAKEIMSTKEGQTLIKTATSNGIKGTELAQFIAQCAHETADFTTLRELGDKNYFKKYDIKFNPAKAKELGNLQPGDGFRYIGRGFIQLTGRYNYKKAGEALGLPLEKHPELVERPDVAAKVAVWFWKNRVQPQVTNFSNTAQATKPINPALKHLTKRQEKFSATNVAMSKQPTTVATAAKSAPKVQQPKPQQPTAKVATTKPTPKGKKV